MPTTNEIINFVKEYTGLDSITEDTYYALFADRICK